jgi:Protein of unknown function (DUF1553)/Protein of unknown function (DUF1549)/Planctomycete cytochrome C
MTKYHALLWVGAWLLLSSASSATAGPTDADNDFFEKKIRPVLVDQCFRCHSQKHKTRKGGLRLDSREALLKGGDSGPAIVPGDPDKSRLIDAIRYKNTELFMPPRGKLADTVVADFTTWVKAGATWPKGSADSTIPDTSGIDIAARKKSHWAWQPVQSQKVPAVKGTWGRGPVDTFILAKLEEKGITPALPAEPHVWLRRITYALTGLPPTPEEIDAFLADLSPSARVKVVDRLLASPHYGERWARHWLDLVRYAETRGHEFEPFIPNAYQYRDYVIRALNADVPYDQFVREHLAGDLLPAPRHGVDGCNESILGTGFWLLGEEVHSPVDVRADQADRFDNRIDVMTKTFLGLTVACARCHDHKFDAITQKDYYALFGFISSSAPHLARFDSLEQNRAAALELARARTTARRTVSGALAQSFQPTLDRLPDYLLAVREVGPSSGESAPTRSAKAALVTDAPRAQRNASKRIQEVADVHKLDAGTLAAWVAAVDESARDLNDPLYAWAKLRSNGGQIGPIAAELRQRQESLRDALKNAKGTVDFGTLSSADWVQDEAAFGAGPSRPGDVRIGGSSDHGVRFVTRGAAEYHRAFDVLRAHGNKEFGAIGSIGGREGRTIRTPTFRIAEGRIHYLVKGAGAAYAAVSGHTVISGPLHSQLVTKFGASPSPGYRWVSQDLTRYAGLDAHIEFSAQPGSDFAVALVVQADHAPTVNEVPADALVELIGKAKTPEELAAGYGKLFTRLADRLTADQVDATDAALADWVARHPKLLTGTLFTEAVESALKAQQTAAAAIRPDSRLGLCLMDGNGVDEHVFIRGSSKAEGESAPRRFLTALAGEKPIGARDSGRLELATQITDPKLNPFVARVIVNRIWHHLFGRGIVGSVDNFGVLGEPPTHPELLDYLADRFIREGWSIKKLIRELTLTETYAMSSHSNASDKVDPNNLLLHRMRLKRLEGEAIRDAMLRVSGRLDPMEYGPSVLIHLTPFLDGRGRPNSGPVDGDGRRSLYLAVRRNFLSPMLLAFDTPTPFTTFGRRTVSNVPAQSLILMNDPFVQEQAGVWAKKVLAQPGNAEQRIEGMYRSAFGRPPTTVERSACLTFLKRQAEERSVAADDPGVWTDLAHMLFNVKDFIFVE